MIRNKIVCGEPDLLIPAHLNYGKFILEKLREGKDEDALVNGETGEKISYSQILQQTVNAAVSLKSLGLKKGDVVALCSENRFDYITSALSAICCGAIVTTANVLYTKDELIHTLNLTKPKYVFCSPFALKTHYATLKDIPFIEKIIIYGDTKYVPGVLFDELKARNVSTLDYEPEDVEGQRDTMVVLHSSGTTGLPKGVMMTHLNMLNSSCGFDAQKMNEYQLKRLLTIVPWHHAYGFMSTLGFLSAGRTVVYLTRFQEEQYVKCIQDFKTDLLIVVPPLVVFLAKSPIVEKYDMTYVKRIWCGAAPLSMEIIEATRKRLPNVGAIIQAYGMTETCLAATKDQETDNKGPKAGSGGSALPGVRIKIVDIDTREKLGPNESGEICVKGALLMKGYVGNPKATAEIFDEEGYLKTGDIGYYDTDGYFFIVDRLKELIKYKGYQVPPAEVEAVLLQHPDVMECGVVGTPDEMAGELPTAFVVKRPGTKVTEKDLIDLVASKLSVPKRLHGGVRFIKEIPKNQTGKVLRRQLRELCAKSPNSKL